MKPLRTWLVALAVWTSWPTTSAAADQADAAPFESVTHLMARVLADSVARLHAATKRQLACDPDHPLQGRIFADYGAVFVAGRGVQRPPQCVFGSAEEVAAFQAGLHTRTETVEGVAITLQAAAMKALLAAVAEAQSKGLRITPNDHHVAAQRTYQDTERLWRSRVETALRHWVIRRKISREEAEQALALPVAEQVQRVLAWEAQGLYFSPDHRRSILYNVAAPGTSQHLALLALDVREHGDVRVRKILARHGWYRTIRSDTPHFTFVGRPESSLAYWGLKPLRLGREEFWIPDRAQLMALLVTPQRASQRVDPTAQAEPSRPPSTLNAR